MSSVCSSHDPAGLLGSPHDRRLHRPSLETILSGSSTTETQRPESLCHHAASPRHVITLHHHPAPSRRTVSSHRVNTPRRHRVITPCQRVITPCHRAASARRVITAHHHTASSHRVKTRQGSAAPSWRPCRHRGQQVGIQVSDLSRSLAAEWLAPFLIAVPSQCRWRH